MCYCCRYRLTLGKVAELEDALQRERVDKVERLQVRGSGVARGKRWSLGWHEPRPPTILTPALQMLQAEAEGEIGRLSGELQQLQVRRMFWRARLSFFLLQPLQRSFIL